MNKKNILKIIADSISEINEMRPNDEYIGQTLETILFDTSREIDSLEFVMLIVSIEKKLKKESGKCVILAEGKTMLYKDASFRSVGALVDYIDSILKDS